ncbi:MAG: phospho-N-acetylmuramoyl-pentapeptide-transferase [Oscillospiraceae bacterium]|nr:phospho-N-acetylmuramoyl-pentapeptide-transferase [Oscillospiraceae bacterium]
MDILSLGIAVVAAFVITALSGKFIIPFLRKLKFGQTILEDGPTWHKAKQGTPTMGGMMFILGIVVAAVVGLITMNINGSDTGSLNQLYFIAGILMATAFGALGFADDYVKVVKKQNLGLTAKQKMAGQLLIAALYLAVLHFGGATSTILQIPFLGQLDIGLLYYPFAMFVIVGTVNAVNLTDGIDGLCSSVTFVAAIGMMIVATILGVTEMNLLAGALAGGCLGFLCWNFHPAKVFMGDTGSLFLGGVVCALAFGVRFPVLLLFVGIIYIVETMSVILQVISFQSTGKRIFKMSPIHHHYEMSGWSEEKIVAVFSTVTAIGCVIAVLAALAL